jgi:DNA-binding cell septation regulator SpoVG
VAQGKRLAEISKAAKAEKKLMMEEEERKESNVGVDYKFVYGFIGVGVGITGLYLAYSRKNTSQEWVDICLPWKWSRETQMEKDVVDTPRSALLAARNREITLEGFD